LQERRITRVDLVLIGLVEAVGGALQIVQVFEPNQFDAGNRPGVAGNRSVLGDGDVVDLFGNLDLAVVDIENGLTGRRHQFTGVIQGQMAVACVLLFVVHCSRRSAGAAQAYTEQ
jgi:hypothetical protein